ncbi:MAG: hypothetical protein MNPFHGCM_01424 [Gemmatimonadaceae bacterium]|nr:hypothetical protein [Gemmatimonadaceae bacterium]
MTLAMAPRNSRDPKRSSRDAPSREALEVHETIRQINSLWLGGRVSRLNEYLLSDVVMIAPAFQERLEGIRAAIESFQAFVRNARVHAFHETDMQIDVWENAAMATFRFDMTYEFDGTVYDDAGRELWLFARVDRRWRLAWRHQIPLSRTVVASPAANRPR